jgi:thiol-disulfide isomerase/thioredoxin
MERSSRIGAAIVVVVALFAAMHAQDTASAVDVELEKGRQLLQRHEYFDALKAFQRANQLAGGKSAESFLGIAQATNGMKVYKNALDACQSAIDLAGSDARLLARAHKLKGQVFTNLGQTRDAEGEFRAALTADPESRLPDLHYLLGMTLMAEHQDEDGVAELKKEIEIRPNGTTADEARALIANPRRARERYAPDFSFVSTAGESISLESLRGKVVLLDFWASWCAPCVRALPSVKKIQKDHASDPFVVVSVSGDHEERPWRAFVDKNGMSWPQYWDRDHQLRAKFDVKVIPTYVLIDREGIEQLRVNGSGFHEERALAAEINKQINLAKQPPL